MHGDGLRFHPRLQPILTPNRSLSFVPEGLRWARHNGVVQACFNQDAGQAQEQVSEGGEAPPQEQGQAPPQGAPQEGQAQTEAQGAAQPSQASNLSEDAQMAAQAAQQQAAQQEGAVEGQAGTQAGGAQVVEMDASRMAKQWANRLSKMEPAQRNAVMAERRQRMPNMARLVEQLLNQMAPGETAGDVADKMRPGPKLNPSRRQDGSV